MTVIFKPDRSTWRAFSITKPLSAVMLHFSNFTFRIGLPANPCMKPTFFVVPETFRMVTLRTIGSTFAGGAMGCTIRHSMLNSNAWRVSLSTISL